MLARLVDLQFANSELSELDLEEKLEYIITDLLKIVDLYAGPEYCFYYKCAQTKILVFMCMIFGPAFPILYLICLVGIIIQYFLERILLTYFYKLPPKFSHQLTLQNIRIIQLCPVFTLALTLWFYTNKQMFGNTIDNVQTMDEIIMSHHLLYQVRWKQFTQPQKELAYALIILLVLIVISELSDTIMKLLPKMGDYAVDF